MEQQPNAEILNNLARCLAWTYDEKVMTLADAQDFIKSIAIEKPNSAIAKDLYRKYCVSIDSAALLLSRKIREAKKEVGNIHIKNGQETP
jgi:hypothetical protein